LKSLKYGRHLPLFKDLSKSSHNHGSSTARIAFTKIMKRSWAFNCVVGTAALLLPRTAAPDSHLQTQAGSAASSVTAHVNFKIIIPPVLYLHVASEGADPRTVAVMSSNHNVTLTATLRAPDDNAAGAPSGTRGDAHIRTPANTVAGTFILSAAARKIVAQEAVCTPSASPHRGVDQGNRVICTASIP
jgi:hypothetical protein